MRSAIEARVLKAAEFASAVIVPFVLDDFKQFFVCPFFLCVLGSRADVLVSVSQGWSQVS